jgi:hypothetical protein
LYILILLTAFVAELSAGCGGGAAAVNSYTYMANEILSDINAKAGDIKKLWVLPVAEQGGMPEAVTDYRKALAAAQEKLDATDSPAPCRELDRMLREAVDKGRELADLATPFADYLQYIAPIAAQVSEMVDTLKALEEKEDVSSGLAQLAEQAAAIDRELRTVMPPSVFNGIHQELLQFANSIAVAFARASGKSTIYMEYDNNSNRADETDGETDDETAPDEESSPVVRPRNSQKLEPIVEEIPDAWERFNGELSSLMDVVREVIGLKAKNLEVEAKIGTALAEIKRLEKEY